MASETALTGSEFEDLKPEDEREDRRSPGRPFPIVGVGASAGGLEAFTQLLKALPPASGMAFVLVQHLDPLHSSQLSELLSRATSMPVREVKDGVSVAPNNVYVIPPNTLLTIAKGCLRLGARPAGPGPVLPIDLFFESLAVEQNRLAVGIVLSGTASDGAQGLRAIKAECGITFAQDEATAKFAGMPRNAISTGSVDFVLPPGSIAEELVRVSRKLDWSTQPSQSQDEPLPEGEADLQRIYSLLYRATRVNFAAYKQSTVRRRVGRRMVVNQQESVSDYLRFVKEKPEELIELYKDILICVTSFFRDPAAYSALAPLLSEMVNEPTRAETIRVWVPGCATGEEVYSLAICLQEAIGQRKSPPSIQFFGTDLSESALQKARAGVYPDSIAAQVSLDRLRYYFYKVEAGYQISKHIRDACVFAKQDLTRDPPFSRMDVISCRNLLIYLGVGLQKTIIPAFHYALNPDGLLLLGSAESVGAASDLFTPVDQANKIYKRRATPVRFEAPFPSFRMAPDPGVETRSVRTLSSQELQRRADRAIQNRYAPDGVVINSAFSILQFRGHTGFYLEPTQGEASHNLLHMARESLQPVLRRVVAAAIESNSIAREKGLRVEYHGEIRDISLEVIPVTGSTPEEHYYLVMFDQTPLPAESGAADPDKEVRSRPELPSHRIERLERELMEAREFLRSEREDYGTTLEELRAANEEVGSANEELQSANEQLGVVKEELQSANEELITVNEELQTRNGEMSIVNNDLTNLIAAVNLPILMFDRSLKLRRFTPIAGIRFQLAFDDLGRSAGELRPNLPWPELEQLARGAVDNLEVETRQVQDPSGSWWTLTARPYRTADHRIEGAVLTFADITQIQNGLEAAQVAKNYAEAITNTIRHPLVILNSDLRVRGANPAFYREFQVVPEETTGRPLNELGSGQWNIPALQHALANLLPDKTEFSDLEVEQTFPALGVRSMWLNGRRIEQETGAPDAILLAIEDVTDREKARRALLRSNEELQQFAYVISHDLQEPLRSIGAFAGLFASRYQDKFDEEGNEWLQYIEHGVTRMSTLISDLLQYARVGTVAEPDRTLVDFNTALQEALWNLQAAITESSGQIAPGVLPTAPYNSRDLTQVFQNLIGNALKYRHPGRTAQIVIAAERSEQEWLLSVKDNGIGFSPQYAERIFGVLQRLHGKDYPGTGIGLAICQRIVEKHGGKIWAESVENAGSTFWFTVLGD